MNHTALNQRKIKWLWILTCSIFSIAFIQTAWICEDAFITLRTVDNIINGFGPVWNIGERVQAYTHPLWLALITPTTYLIGDPYITLIFISYALIIATLLIVKATRQAWGMWSIIAILSLLWSRSFIDYSSSGLENPLSHFLIATFLFFWIHPHKKNNPLILSLLASALYLNRPDGVVLIAPALLQVFWQHKKIIPLLIGSLPAITWSSFSLLYYGSLIPNTALAKLATGTPLSTRIQQAINYIDWTLHNDPMTIIIIILGTIAGFSQLKLRALAIGLILWIMYLCFIGADYMGGRFFSSATLAAAILMALASNSALNLSLILSLGSTAWILIHTIGSPSNFENKSISPSGVADERGFYYSKLGMLPSIQQHTWQTHRWFKEGRLASRTPGVYTRCAIGVTGYTAGPQAYIIDPLALSEPFLARLPSRPIARVGHYERAFPAGFLASRIQRKNLIDDPKLKALYADVLLATQSKNLLTVDRLNAIWRLTTNQHQTAISDHDRDAIGLPGHPRITNEAQSCYGIPYGWSGFYRLEGSPPRAIDILDKRTRPAMQP